MANIFTRILNFRAERREDTSSITNPKEWLYKIFGNKSTSGVIVSENNAYNLSAYFRGISLYCDHISTLPINIFLKQDGKRTAKPNHPVKKLISGNPNPLMNANTWLRLMVKDMLNLGNGYGRIYRNGFNLATEIAYRKPSDVSPFVYKNQLYYQISGENGERLPVPAADMLHFKKFSNDGITGLGLIAVAREVFGESLGIQQYGQNTYKEGGGKRLAIVTEKKLDPDQVKQLQGSWVKKRGGIENSGTVPVLHGGQDIKEIGMNPNDADWLSGRKFTVQEMARILCLPPYKLGDTESQNRATVEQLAIEYVQDSLMPLITIFETELKNKLFDTINDNGLYFKFNIDALLRGDTAARAALYKTLWYIGSINRNEIREKEDMNPIGEEGDKYYIPQNMITDNKLDEITLLKLANKKKEVEPPENKK